MRIIVPMIVLVVAAVVMLGDPELLVRLVIPAGPEVHLPDVAREDDAGTDGAFALAATD